MVSVALGIAFVAKLVDDNALWTRRGLTAWLPVDSRSAGGVLLAGVGEPGNDLAVAVTFEMAMWAIKRSGAASCQCSDRLPWQ